MVQIFTAEQLAAVWGLVSLDPSPLDALGREDVVLSEGLRRRLDVPIAKRRPPRERAALLDRLMEPRVGLLPQRLSFGIRPAVGRSAARSLPKGEYDVVVALRIDVINQVLAGLFETHAWQNSIPVAEVEEQLSLGALRAFSDDIPDVDGLKVGALRLSRPATVSVDSERRILASQSLVLDLITTNDRCHLARGHGYPSGPAGNTPGRRRSRAHGHRVGDRRGPLRRGRGGEQLGGLAGVPYTAP
jgi:hypothetical protein